MPDNDLKPFLQPSKVIDWESEEVFALARQLANSCTDDVEIARRCFLWVRDEVRHSHDYGIPVVTCAASEVLKHRAGYCYAKSHLLAALLRANGIPSALCYQRLQVSETDQRFTLHGLNAVFLKSHGWYRIDARGNKPGVDAQFSPPVEQLAFPPVVAGEHDIPGRYAEPWPIIKQLLENCATEAEVFERLPDWAPKAPVEGSSEECRHDSSTIS